MARWLVKVGFFLLIIFLGGREYQVRQVYEITGSIIPCRYVVSAASCKLFTTPEGKFFVLTDGSIRQLADIANFSQEVSLHKQWRIKAQILGQKVQVVGLGNLPKIRILEISNQ